MILQLVFVLALYVPTVLSEFPLKPEDRIESAFKAEKYKVDLKFVKLFTEPYPTRFSGTVTISLKCTNKNFDSRFIKLHSKKRYGIKIKERAITVKKDTNTKVLLGGWFNPNPEVEKISYDITEDILVIKMKEPLKLEDTYEVLLKFDGTISEDNGYVVYYPDKNPYELGVRGMSYLVATNSERQNAFPCIDEPDSRANIQVTAALSHGDGIATVNLVPQSAIGYIVPQSIFSSGEIRFPPSQVAFVVTNLVMKTPVAVQFNQYWTGMFHQRSLAETNPSAISGRESMVKDKSEFMTSAVPQVGFWVIPTKQEIKSFKWGLAIISEREIDEESEDKRLYNYYIRFTRMIFGGMISSDRWEADEYFAALAEYLARLQVSKEEVDKLITVRWERPSGDIDEIMEKGLDNFETGMSDRNKGLLLFRMLHHFSDDNLFLPDLMEVIRKYEYKSITLDKLFEEFKGELPGDGITTWVEAMHKYTDQPGYPVITATRLENGRFKFVQEPFVGSIKERMANEFTYDSSGKFRIWPIPISYQVFDVDKGSTVGETEWNMWIFFRNKDYQEPSYDRENFVGTKTKDGHVVVFNIQCIGLYRVRYEDNYWEKIVQLLKSNRRLLDPTTRACIVHDAFSLAWAGYQDYEKVLSLLPFLRTEDDDLVWHSFFYAATDVAEVLEFSRETYAQFQIYVKSLLMAIFNSKYASNNYFQRMNAGNDKKINTVDAFYMHWACYITRIAECVRQAKDIVKVWLKAGKDQQQPLKSKGDIKDYRSLLRTAYCTVLTEERKGIELIEIADFMRSLMSLSIQNQAYRDAFIEAVQCVPKISSIVYSFLEMTCTDEETPISNAMTLEDKQNVFINLARGKDSYLEVFEYLKKHLNDKIIDYHKSYEFVGRVISTLAARMTTAEVTEMDQFIKETYMLKDNKAIKKSFEEGKAANARRQKWLEINDGTIRNAIKTKFCVTAACDF